MRVDDEGALDEQRSASRVGDRLRIARELQDLSIEDVAARTRVPTRHLLMIEQGRYEGLPAATYSAGFVKAYARLVGLDEQALSDEFRGEMGSTAPPPHKPAPYEPADPRRTPPAWLALLALLLAVVGGLGFLYARGSPDQPSALAARSGDEPAAPAAPRPGAGPPAQPATPAGAAGGPVVIGASQDVWMKVTDRGRTLVMRIFKAGEHFQLPADAVDPLLTTGRPGFTTIMVGATPIPPVGDPDRIAKNVPLNAAALLARVATPAPAVQPPPGTPTPVENAAGPE